MDVLQHHYAKQIKLWIDDSETFKKEQELDRRRNLKLFIHFALLCEKYPNWSVTPDPNDPFKNITLFHSNGKYKIESCYPGNAVKLWGVNKVQVEVFKTGPETTSRYTFFGWAIGMDDTPNWIKE